MSRPDGRTPDQLRPISFTPGIAPHSTGSVLVAAGNTRVICSAMIEESVPGWMKAQKVPGGWLTAEYSMLPYSTLDRKPRDSAKGRLDGRSVEIQRLIGRSLRAVIDLDLLGPRTLCIDCDVLQADGGTRTASITGACVAASLAVEQLIAKGLLNSSPIRKMIAAVSVGVAGGVPGRRRRNEVQRSRQVRTAGGIRRHLPQRSGRAAVHRNVVLRARCAHPGTRSRRAAPAGALRHRRAAGQPAGRGAPSRCFPSALAAAGASLAASHMTG